MFGPGPLEIGLLVFIAGFVVVILPYWRIFSKAGFNGWLGLAMIVPVVNIIMLYYLAFAQWPIEEELNRIGKGSPGG